MQLSLPFLTAYESYIASQAIEALDSGSKTDTGLALTAAFHDRNVSRILVQKTVASRQDFLFHWSMAIFRVLLGEGNWITRVVTPGREGLITDSSKAVAQNLATESNGFELANRNQYGMHFGRGSKPLNIDGRTVCPRMSPLCAPTLPNNGVVHLLQQLAKHWNNMLDQKFGNFAHQRMEQLDPFGTLRGRNHWGAHVLGPFIQKLQALRPGRDTSDARKLVRQKASVVAIINDKWVESNGERSAA